MNREQADRLLAALIFDDLDEASKAELLAYLQTDDELRDRLADLRMAVKLTSDAVNEGPEPVLAERRLKRLKCLAKTGKAKVRVFPMRLLAVAAVLVFALVLLDLSLPRLSAPPRNLPSLGAVDALRGRIGGVGRSAASRVAPAESRSSAVAESVAPARYLSAEPASVPTDHFTNEAQQVRNDGVNGMTSNVIECYAVSGAGGVDGTAGMGGMMGGMGGPGGAGQMMGGMRGYDGMHGGTGIVAFKPSDYEDGSLANKVVMNQRPAPAAPVVESNVSAGRRDALSIIKGLGSEEQKAVSLKEAEDGRVRFEMGLGRTLRDEKVAATDQPAGSAQDQVKSSRNVAGGTPVFSESVRLGWPGPVTAGKATLPTSATTSSDSVATDAEKPDQPVAFAGSSRPRGGRGQGVGDPPR